MNKTLTKRNSIYHERTISTYGFQREFKTERRSTDLKTRENTNQMIETADPEGFSDYFNMILNNLD
jgi:uncharacterized protein YaiI (UPF0178 family)